MFLFASSISWKKTIYKIRRIKTIFLILQNVYKKNVPWGGPPSLLDELGFMFISNGSSLILWIVQEWLAIQLCLVFTRISMVSYKFSKDNSDNVVAETGFLLICYKIIKRDREREWERDS